jgi:hypothetical protein
MNNQTNRIQRTIKLIAATLTPAFNRVVAAKRSLQKMLGFVPEGAGRYRMLCPKGAGHCAGHTFAEQQLVGRRAFTRRQRRFVQAMKYSPWGKAVNRA